MSDHPPLFHVPVHLHNSAGLVPDPLQRLIAAGATPPWYYRLRYNPANFKPSPFEGINYIDVYTLIHEPRP